MKATCSRIKTYERVLLKHFFAFRSQLDRQHGDFPPVVAPPDARAQRAPQDLVPEADADDADARLLKQSLCERDELQDPGGVVEGVVFCRVSYVCSDGTPKCWSKGAAYLSR